ncbi:uncharacterized protein LOC114758826 [Neltuma alba]|uniref:uncharacterized protein LOC114758826 n=1 Tax=Neltuma alba TaxID=207710 RepID=UPI0010A3A4A2|nr:uncharacterized protein LOC114758826 [Prosopis alba]
MGLRVYQSPKRMQSSLFRAPRSVCHPCKPPSVFPSSSLRHLNDSNVALSFRLVHRFAFRGSKVLRLERVRRTCNADSGEWFDEEMMMNLVRQAAKEFDIPYEEDEDDKRAVELIHKISEKIQNTEQLSSSEKSSLEQIWTTKHDVLEPSELGIEPEPSSWPESAKMPRAYFERKVNYLGIPFSIRMIQKKLQWQKNLTEAKECTYCSVKKTFSSVVFIIHELQNYALKIRENLYCEDLQDLVRKIQSDVDASFVWLFQKILWKTPSLMVYTMVLLANFSVLSMNNNTALAATPLITRVQMLTDRKGEGGSEVDVDAVSEKILWNSMLEEARRLQELRSETLDNETMKMFVAPVSVELEGDAYEEYERTELYYKEHINQAPRSSLLLSNYAQFLYLVYHDVDRAEEYFRRAVMVKPQDAEALSRYADFLWLVRKDLKEAEVRYLQAMQVDPDSTHYKSKFATFIWSISDQGTCSPSSVNSDSLDPVP